MQFLKENFDNILKLYINQIGVAIFSMFLYTAAGAIDSEYSLITKVFISLFSILFYCVLIYNVAWEIGAKDKIRIDAKRLERTPSKGIKIGLWSNSLNFLVIGIALILYVLYAITNVQAFHSIFAILNLIFRFFVSMYLGVIQGICVVFESNEHLYWISQTVLYIVFSGVSAAIIHLSYILGLKDWRIIKKSNARK